MLAIKGRLYEKPGRAFFNFDISGHFNSFITSICHMLISYFFQLLLYSMITPP